MSDEYELTEDDAARLNSLPVQSHRGFKAGEKYPAVVSRVDDVNEFDHERQRQKKTGEIHHVHVFLPDHVETLHVHKDYEEPKETDEEKRARLRAELDSLGEDDGRGTE